MTKMTKSKGGAQRRREREHGRRMAVESQHTVALILASLGIELVAGAPYPVEASRVLEALNSVEDAELRGRLLHGLVTVALVLA